MSLINYDICHIIHISLHNIFTVKNTLVHFNEGILKFYKIGDINFASPSLNLIDNGRLSYTSFVSNLDCSISFQMLDVTV